MVAYIKNMVIKRIDGVEELILNALDVFDGEGIYIWGAGQLGIPLAYYLLDRRVKLEGVIDNQPASVEEKIKNNYKLQELINKKAWTPELNKDIRIFPFDEIKDGAKIFVAIALQDRVNDVVNQINWKHTKTRVVTYIDLYDEGMDI